MYRHFAYFSQFNGRYLREWAGEVPPPPRFWLWRQQRLNTWATSVSRPERGEVGLDVTQFDYPLGDFCWARFDVVDRRLDFLEPHKFVEVDLRSLTIVANTTSSRPVRSHGTRAVIDITGTRLEPFHGQLFGPVQQIAGGWWLGPSQCLSIVTGEIRVPLDIDIKDQVFVHHAD